MTGASNRTATFADGSELSVDAVIWASGFGLDHTWIELPVTDDTGQLIHRRGVTEIPGLYFLGLPWQHTRGSALLGWVKDDAEYIAEQISDGAAPTDLAPPDSAAAGEPGLTRRRVLGSIAETLHRSIGAIRRQPRYRSRDPAGRGRTRPRSYWPCRSRLYRFRADSWAGARLGGVRRRTRERHHGCGPNLARAWHADALRARGSPHGSASTVGACPGRRVSGSLASPSSSSGRAVACWVGSAGCGRFCSRHWSSGRGAVRTARSTTGRGERFSIRRSSSWDWSPSAEHSRPSPKRRRQHPHYGSHLPRRRPQSLSELCRLGLPHRGLVQRSGRANTELGLGAARRRRQDARLCLRSGRPRLERKGARSPGRAPALR